MPTDVTTFDCAGLVRQWLMSVRRWELPVRRSFKQCALDIVRVLCGGVRYSCGYGLIWCGDGCSAAPM